MPWFESPTGARLPVQPGASPTGMQDTLPAQPLAVTLYADPQDASLDAEVHPQEESQA